MLVPENDKEYILSRIKKDDNGCWVWLRAKTNGYGKACRNNKPCLAHRLSYEAHIGKIPNGLTIDHLCRNRACVNPDHLETVTNRENVLRGNGITAINARKTRCVRGHKLVGSNLLKHRLPVRECNICYKLHRARYKRLGLYP